MKKILLVSLLFLSFSSAFAKIVDWKGKEMGAECNPKWLKNYVQKNDEKALRKKFDLEKSDLVIMGYSASTQKENAQYESEAKALLKIQKEVNKNLKEKKNEASIVVLGTEKIFDYWVQNEDGNFHYYCFYSISDSAFQRMIKINSR